jgi:hypothetical protein
MAGLSYVGSLTLGAVVPTYASAIADAYAELSAQLAGLSAVNIALTVGPPSLTAAIEASAKVTAALSAAVDGPTITLQAEAQLGLIAALEAQVAALAELVAAFAAPGVHMWDYGGDVQDFAPALQGDLAARFPPYSPSAALVLLAQTPEAAAAISTAFGTILVVESSP